MTDDTVAMVENAYGLVRTTLRSMSVSSGVATEPDASAHRLAYQLFMAGAVTKQQLAAVDHFQRAHALLTGRRIAPAPEVAAEFADSARRIVGAVDPAAVAA